MKKIEIEIIAETNKQIEELMIEICERIFNDKMQTHTLKIGTATGTYKIWKDL